MRGHLGEAEDLALVRHRPSHQRQIVQQRFRQIAGALEIAEADGIAALGELAAVRVAQQRQVVVGWHLPAEGVVEQPVLRHRADPFFAPQHVADAHQVVVHDHREVVGGKAVGLHQHLHVHLPPGDFNAAAQAVLEAAGTLVRHRQAQHVRLAILDAPPRLGLSKAQAEAIVARRLASRLLRAPHFGQALGRAEAGKRPALLQQQFGMAAVDSPPLALAIGPEVAADVRPFVPVEACPAQRVDDGRLCRRTAAGTVRVFDAQHEAPAPALGEDAVEERHVGRADVGISRRTGRDAGADRSHAFKCSGAAPWSACPTHARDAREAQRRGGVESP